jgi:SAM-dependent methyltransferase
MDKTSSPIVVLPENVADLWESLPTDWPRLKYEEDLVDDLTEKFHQHERQTGVKINRILDCGCGTGNPSIGLAKKGFEIVAVDKDQGMIERFKENCSEAGVEIQVQELDWRNLYSLVEGGKPLFDVVMCRGNGLIYVESWDRSQFSPSAARVGIESSLRAMASVLKPGGILYVDMPSARELEGHEHHLEVLGRREANGKVFISYWLPHYNTEQRIRRLEVTRIEHFKENSELACIRRYTFVGYLCRQEELLDLMRTSGCEIVEKKQIRGEHLYDSFWGYKH